MPDISSAPGIPSPTALYPQPPQQQPGLVSNPGQVLDLLGKIQQNYALGQELKARAAVGQAYQGALQPDGTIDPEKLRSGLANPDASWMLPETMNHVLAQKTAQFDLAAKQNQFVIDGLGTLADKPGVNMDDVRNFVVTAARAANIPPGILTGWMSSLPRDPGKLREALQMARSQAIGSAGLATRVAGPPVPGTNAPTSISGGQSIYAGPQGMPVAPPPGTSEAQSAEATEGQHAAIALQNAANEVPNQRTQLDLMRQDLATSRSKFGPTAPYEKTANIIAGRIAGFHPTMTPQEIAGLESFDKVGRQIAMSQAGALHATDATLSTALGANPNTNLSALGNEGIINMLHGNTDAIAVKANAWNDARMGNGPDHRVWGPDQFYQWSNQFNKNFDPRVFQFMRMTPDQQQTLLSSMPDKAQFERHLVDADKRGWITLPPAPRAPGAPKAQERVPSAVSVPPKPPVPGIQLGRRADGSPGWFIPDPARPGKHLEVRLPGLQ